MILLCWEITGKKRVEIKITSSNHVVAFFAISTFAISTLLSTS